MAATVKLIHILGPKTAPQFIEIDSQGIRYGTGDFVYCDVKYSNKLPPPNNFYYSYWKHICLALEGDFTLITNIRLHAQYPESGWNLGTDGGQFLALLDDDSQGHGCPISEYDQARGYEKITGFWLKDPANGHQYYKNQTIEPIDLKDVNEENAILIDNTEYTGESYTKAAVLQLRIAPDAQTGEFPDCYLIFSWDEI